MNNVSAKAPRLARPSWIERRGQLIAGKTDVDMGSSATQATAPNQVALGGVLWRLQLLYAKSDLYCHNQCPNHSANNGTIQSDIL